MKNLFRNQNKGLSHLYFQGLHSMSSVVFIYAAIQTLDKEEYGNFSYYYGLLPLISIPFYSYVYYPLTVFHDKIDIRLLKKLGIIISLICSIIVAISALFMNITYAILLMFSIIVTYIFEFKRRIFLINLDIPRMTVLQLSRMSIFISILYLCKVDEGEKYFMIILLSSIIAFLLVYKNGLNILYPHKPTIDLKKFSTPILKSNLIDNISVYGASYVAIVYLDSNGLAEMNAPRIILGVFSVLSLALENLIGKDVSETATYNGKLISALLPHKSYFILAVFVLLFMTIFRKNIANVLLGSDYNSVGLTIYLYSGFIMLISRPLIIYLRASRHSYILPRISLLVLSFSMLTMVALNRYPSSNNFIIAFLLVSLFQFMANLYYHIKFRYVN